jgi:hypothetical protein
MKPDYADRLEDIYLNKPEAVIHLPEWLLSPRKIDRYRSMQGLAVVEIAGRDSVAAAIKAVDERGFTDLIPVYAYTGTEYGPWSSVLDAVHRLVERLPDVRIHDLLVIGSPRFWQVLNGRFSGELISRYGFYTPCVGCHLYLHSVRLPLSVSMAHVPIIGGEREQHDGRLKVNQIPEALDIYRKTCRHFDVELFLPLRYIPDGKRIEEILGIPWAEGEEQLGCVLSGNYRLLGGHLNCSPEQVRRYLEEFAAPCAKKIIESYISGRVPNHLKIAEETLGRP